MDKLKSIAINLDDIKEGLALYIDERRGSTLFHLEDAIENMESPWQLVEGFSYDYEFSDETFSFGKDQLVQPHSRKRHIGTISPNIYVGTLTLPVLHKDKDTGKTVELEVQSLKANYREDYRDMLQYITEKCTDLLMQASSPVVHNFETDYEQDSVTLYQKFAFIRSIISNEEFNEAVHRIVTSPVTKWKETSELGDIRNTRRFRNKIVQELCTSSKRVSLPENNSLQSFGLKSIPNRITTIRKTDTVDTPENRFIKYALELFLKFCLDINKRSKVGTLLYKESSLVIRNLESHLHHSIFKEISRPSTLKINSPILQRKEGYREVLRVWLMFDLAAKLVWKGGEDVYSAGKKDIAVLYEYWVFFKLLDLFRSICEIEPKALSELIQPTDNDLNLQIKQGIHTALKGVYDTGSRKLHVRFNYNRSFRGNSNYPSGGSWTNAMRPDYTLSIWPCDIVENDDADNNKSEAEAERQELIVHIHFDAKYKIANLTDLLIQESDKNLDQEKTENRKGIYKNADLLKMHAYKDAIRRTGGAYILYPGDESITKKGFHEIVPGLGAFSVRPSKIEDGISELKTFILKVMNHFLNRASQRERLAYRVYDIHKNDPSSDVRESLPEPFGNNRGLIPDETYVLVGYYKDLTHYQWISTKGIYNIRIDTRLGAIPLTYGEISSKFLLLHTEGEDYASELWEIVGEGPRVYSSEKMRDEGYHTTNSYLIFQVRKTSFDGFKNVKWDFKKLPKYKSRRLSALPFSVTLTELMKVKIKE